MGVTCGSTPYTAAGQVRVTPHSMGAGIPLRGQAGGAHVPLYVHIRGCVHVH